MRNRKYIALLLSLLLALACTACGFTLPADMARTPEDESSLILLEPEEAAEENMPALEAEKTPAGEDDGSSEADESLPPEETAPADGTPEDSGSGTTPEEETEEPAVSEDGVYDSRDEVALYIHLYGHLPSNYITKKEAQALGWTGGSLESYAPGKCIGGSYFGNYEGLLPEKRGRTYTECDIDTMGARSRGGKRIVFSNDGLIYYTDDHYESFTLLYGEDDL